MRPESRLTKYVLIQDIARLVIKCKARGDNNTAYQHDYWSQSTEQQGGAEHAANWLFLTKDFSGVPPRRCSRLANHERVQPRAKPKEARFLDLRTGNAVRRGGPQAVPPSRPPMPRRRSPLRRRPPRRGPVLGGGRGLGAGGWGRGRGRGQERGRRRAPSPRPDRARWPPPRPASSAAV